MRWYAIVMFVLFFFQAEDGIRDLVRSRGLGDVYKRQDQGYQYGDPHAHLTVVPPPSAPIAGRRPW